MMELCFFEKLEVVELIWSINNFSKFLVLGFLSRHINIVDSKDSCISNVIQNEVLETTLLNKKTEVHALSNNVEHELFIANNSSCSNIRWIESLMVSIQKLCPSICMLGTAQGLNMEQICCQHLNEDQSWVALLVSISFRENQIVLDQNEDDGYLNGKYHLGLKEKICLLWQRTKRLYWKAKFFLKIVLILFIVVHH
jgi:hypothetical protein